MTDAGAREDKEKKKRHKEAQEHLQKAIEEMGQGAFDQALQEFQTADALEPSPSITQHIGECQEALGNSAAAITAYRKYLKDSGTAPDADIINKHINEIEAVMHADSGRKLVGERKFDEAIKEFEAAQAAKVDPRIWYEIANAYEEHGDSKNAVVYYRRYIKESPGAPDLGEVDGRISVLEGKRIAAPPPPPPPQPPMVRRPFYTSKAGMALGAVGIASLAVGGAFLGLSASASDTADTTHSESAFNDATSSGTTYSYVGLALLGVGAVALITSVVLLVLHTRPQPAEGERKSPLEGQPTALAPLGGSPFVFAGSHP